MPMALRIAHCDHPEYSAHRACVDPSKNSRDAPHQPMHTEDVKIEVAHMPPKKKSACPHLISDAELAEYNGLGLRKHREAYRVTYTDPARPNAHGLTYGPAFTTREEALELLGSAERHLASLGMTKKQRKQRTWTMSEVYAAWHPEAARTRSPQTMALYASVWTNHLAPRFGAYNITRMTPPATQGLLKALEREGVSASMRTKVAAVLRLMLRWAMEEGITHRDLSVGIKGVTEDRGKHKGDFLNASQLKKLLRAVKKADSWYYPVTLVMAHTGLRIGEALALRWDTDIVLDGNDPYVQVSHTLSQERTLKEPKTKAARRKVYMTPVLAKTLRAFRAEQERKGVKHPEGLAMITREGTPISDDNYRTRVFKPAVEVAGIKTRCVPHTLRHSMLSMAATKGVPPTTIMAIAGHEDFRTTAEIYVGTPEASLAEAAAIVARAMG